MTIRHLLLADAGHCLRAAAPPVLLLGLLTAAGTVEPALLSAGVLGIAWQAATVASTAWLLIVVAVAADRPRRDRRAHKRLQQLRDLAAERDRALVHVKTTIWSSTAGQHAVVLNIATGALHRVWLPETTVPVGAFAVLEHTNRGVRVIDVMDARGVESAHRHGMHQTPSMARVGRDDPEEQGADHDAPSQLIIEIEAFLKGSGSS